MCICGIGVCRSGWRLQASTRCTALSLGADGRIWLFGHGCMFRLTWAQGYPCRSEEHTSELQSLRHLVCRLLLEKKKKTVLTLGGLWCAELLLYFLVAVCRV